jgi:DNA primase catalytic subunit
MTWRQSTIEELKDYYFEEFPAHFEEIPSFITESQPKELGVAFPEPYPVSHDRSPPRDFVRRSAFEDENYDDAAVLASWGQIVEFIQNPAGMDPISGKHELVSPALVDEPSIPDAVYFATDRHDGNWMLVVDIDAKDVALERAKERFPTSENATTEEMREQAGIVNGDPAGRKYEFEDIQTALECGFEVEHYFNDRLDTDQTQVVYSGQGAHVYLYDNDPYYRYDSRARAVIVDALTEKQDIPIDEQVTTDESRVIRLPYSLHADVSRVVTPVESPDFDFRTAAQPAFLETDN